MNLCRPIIRSLNQSIAVKLYKVIQIFHCTDCGAELYSIYFLK